MARRPAALPILFVYVAARLFWVIADRPWPILDLPFVEGLLKFLIWVVPSLLIVMAMDRLSLHNTWRSLGLGSHPASGLAFGLLATIPMVFAAPFGPIHPIAAGALIGSVMLGPFAEEVLFRGFLYTQLVRRAGWRVPTAIAISAVVFAVAHLGDIDMEIAGRLLRFGLGFEETMLPNTLVRIGAGILMLAPGGALFAWILHRSGSLWPAIGLHAFLNLWWMVAHGEESRVGLSLDVSGIAQVASIALALALALTVRRPGTRKELVIDNR